MLKNQNPTRYRKSAVEIVLTLRQTILTLLLVLVSVFAMVYSTVQT